MLYAAKSSDLAYDLQTNLYGSWMALENLLSTSDYWKGGEKEKTRALRVFPIETCFIQRKFIPIFEREKKWHEKK